MEEGFTKHVEELVNTTGYPVELFVLDILNKHNYNAWSNEYFQDFDSGKDRSVDALVPSFMAHHLANDVLVRGELVIECKKSPETAWIFFESNLPVMLEYAGQFIDYRQFYTGDYTKDNKIWSQNKNLFLHYGQGKRVSRISKNFQVVAINQKNMDNSKKESKTKVQSKDTILEAVSQVTKSIIYSIKTIEKRTITKWFEGGNDAFFYLAFPIIVYDGPIYNGKLVDGKIKLEERDHVVLETHVRVPYAEDPQRFYIDIIKKEKFENLINQLENDKNKIIGHIEASKNIFSEEVRSWSTPVTRYQKIHNLDK